jgi:hypothetical protein
LEEGRDAHTGIFRTLVPEDYIKAGKSVSVGKSPDSPWCEHVVPCCVIRNCCNKLFDQNKSIEDAATFIEAHLKLVTITTQEQEKLDKQFRQSMPKGWDCGGDIWARFKEAEIVIESDVG